MLDSNSTANAHATADAHATAYLHATADLKGERMRGDLYARKPAGRGNLTFALLFLGYSSEKKRENSCSHPFQDRTRRTLGDFGV